MSTVSGQFKVTDAITVLQIRWRWTRMAPQVQVRVVAADKTETFWLSVGDTISETINIAVTP